MFELQWISERKNNMNNKKKPVVFQAQAANWRKPKTVSKFTFYCYAWVLLQLPIGYLEKKKTEFVLFVSLAAMVLIPCYRASIWGWWDEIRKETDELNLIRNSTCEERKLAQGNQSFSVAWFQNRNSTKINIVKSSFCCECLITQLWEWI